MDGAYDLQVGSRFALCGESGMRADLREQIIEAGAQDNLDVETSPLMSPTGYPIKYVDLPGTVAQPGVSEARTRLPDITTKLSHRW